MTDVRVHFRGLGSERRRFPALPRPGDYLEHDGTLFRIVTVVFNKAVHAYAVHVDDTLAGELRGVWAGWSDPPTVSVASNGRGGIRPPQWRNLTLDSFSSERKRP
jgi:hypothetical protein